MTQFVGQSIHTEMVLQEHFITELITHEGYLRRVGSDKSRLYEGEIHFDRSLAMDRDLVVRFIKETQPDAWAKLKGQYKTSAEDTLFRQLEKSLKNRGLLDVLRKGIKLVPNIEIRLCHFRPASGLEPKRIAEYEGNILSIMDEVEYSQKNANRIDMVLFVNGLPVATIEAKNRPTGTTFRDAEKQYRDNRSHTGEPLLTFKRGALVHFALDEDNASMTTRLRNSKTRFLPFNRGRNGGAGNPDVKGEHRIAYFYKSGEWGDAILSRSVLLDVLGRFAHLESNEHGKALIFPRFHQLNSVRKILTHAKRHGPGNNYLIQHSAGSGKSNTIGWLAHQAINLHDERDRQVFNTVIIVTNRVVLDRQLQSTVAQFEQTLGIVKKIEGTSRQLKEAIATNARIIVTTIQKFSTEHLNQLSGQRNRTFAVIVDEAHSGLTGRSATALTDALTREVEATSSDDIEDMIAEYQRARGPQPNLSFFAFTATPRNVTLERFGSKIAKEPPEPFHLYSMRQAIEEKFILDVLRNYMTYTSYYDLEKAIEDDPEFSSRRGQRKVARYASLHPTAIGQKVEIVIEHFRRHVMDELDGQAKAMIVTQSREHAYRYYQSVNKYIQDQGYGVLKALVAFSGELNVDGITTRETQLNDFAETELPSRFDGVKSDGTSYEVTYSILIVAEKYQTGFDQPKLCAMYVDRQLSGLQAVQTLSRLNRTHAGKENTFILDFQNKIEDIQEAFKPFYHSTELEAASDPNQIYDLQFRLFSYGYLDKEEIETFSQIYFKRTLDASYRPRLEEIIRYSIQRFEQDEDEKRQDEFRQLLKSFNRFYSFIAQVFPLQDTNLEKLHAYGEFLSRLLPNREVPPDIEITDDMLNLRSLKFKKGDEESASLSPGDTATLDPITGFGAKPYTDEELEELSKIVETFNDHHGTDFTEDDIVRLEQVNEEILDEDLVDQLLNNPPDVVYNAYSEAFMKSLIRMFQKNREMQDILMKDPEARGMAIRLFFNRALTGIRETG